MSKQQTHHSELLQFLVAFDEERTFSVSCPVAVAFASPACGGGNKWTTDVMTYEAHDGRFAMI